jgi:multimeric flavodoxin WrbA
MKKVTAIIGTGTRKTTFLAVKEIERNLKLKGDIEFEYVDLSASKLEFCLGCKRCFLEGEECCPSKDDRDLLLGKLERVDGVIFATPNYAFQVSGRMKNMIDRLAFLYHRPRFFDKAFTAVVAQAFFGGGGILKYLEGVGANLGFHVSKGCVVSALDPMTDAQREALRKAAAKTADRFYRELFRPVPPPSFFRLFIFRMARTSLSFVDDSFRDRRYYKERGWFESDYYYPVRLGLAKKLAGKAFDLFGRRVSAK